MTETSITIGAGLFKRGAIKRGIEYFCSVRNIRLSISEERHLLYSVFTVSLSGEGSDIDDLIGVIASVV